MKDERPPLSQEELEKEDAEELPDREEMSVIQGFQPAPVPPVIGIEPGPPTEVR